MIDSSEIKVKSLQKAMQVLNCFTERQPLGVTEISEKLGLYKSNVHNILSTFKAMEYLEQDAATGKYHLGNSVFDLCRAMGDSFTISQIAAPYMQQIVKEVNEIVYLAVPHEDEAVFLDAVYPIESYRPIRSLLGERTKMYCSGVGKAMMAFLPEEEIELYLDRKMVACTDYTITNKENLREELALVRQRGYAIDNMELEFGIRCVGIPIFNRNGKIEGGMSISGPSLRISDERIREIEGTLKRYVSEIQRKL